MESVANYALEKAMECMEVNKAKSFAHLLLALSLRSEWKSDMYSTFLKLIDSISTELITNFKITDFFKYFEQALELYPERPELKHCFSKHLNNLGFTYKAFFFLASAIRLKPEDPVWSNELDEIKNVLVERWHFRMLNDSIRNNAYKSAISRCVDENSIVLDIGSGTGLLTLYAAENRPKKLIAIERNEALYNVAAAVFNDNNVKNALLKNVDSNSLDSNIVGKASIVITEIFDGGFFGEGILQTLIYAHKNLMEKKISDIIIPKSGSLYLCGLESEKLRKKFAVVNPAIGNYVKMDSLVICNSCEEPYDTEELSNIQDLKYVTNIQSILNINLLDLEQMEKLYKGEEILIAELRANKTTNVIAFGLWFDLHLIDDIAITTNPSEQNRAKAWEQAVFHLLKPIFLQESDHVNIQLSCESGKLKLLNLRTSIDEDFVYPVPIEIVRILNDNNYTNACDMAAGAICVHLSQLFSLKDMHILDVSPFPVLGMLLLNRGIQTLTCVTDSQYIRELILKIASLNAIDHSNIVFLNENNPIDYKVIQSYNVFINNLFDSPRTMNHKRIKQSINIMEQIDNHKCIIVPHKIRLVCKLIYSQEVERTNRVDNINVSNYKIAESINLFQVSQSYISDLSSFVFKTMSNDVVIFEQCIGDCINTILDVAIIEDGVINAVMCWYEIKLLEKWEFYSSLESDSFLDITLHLLEPNLFGSLNQKGSLLVCVEDGFMKLAVDLDTSP